MGKRRGRGYSRLEAVKKGGSGRSRQPNKVEESRFQPRTPSTEVQFAEITPEEQRADVVKRLRVPGERRASLATELARLDQTIKPLVQEAVRLGIPYRRVSELAGISRATVARWVAENT